MKPYNRPTDGLRSGLVNPLTPQLADMSKPQAVSQQKILQPVPKHIIEIGYQRKLTFWESLKCLIGYTLVVDIKVMTTNSPGHFESRMTIRATEEPLLGNRKGL